MKNLNNNQVRIFATAAVLTIILASAGLATAQGPRSGKSMGQCGVRGGGNSGPGHRIEMMAKRLDLSEEQLVSIKKIHEESRLEGVEKRKSLMRLRNELKGEMLKDSPSEKEVLSINSKMGELKTEMKALQLKTRLAVREELTAEQRDQMLGMDGKSGRQGMRGHRGSDGCDGPRNNSHNGCRPSGGRGQGMGSLNDSDSSDDQ